MLWRDKSFLAGIITFIVVGLVCNVLLKVEWFPTLAIASVIGVIVGLAANRILKG